MEDQVQETHAEYGDADHGQTHDGARLEGDVEPLPEASSAGGRRSDVRLDGDRHA